MSFLLLLLLLDKASNVNHHCTNWLKAPHPFDQFDPKQFVVGRAREFGPHVDQLIRQEKQIPPGAGRKQLRVLATQPVDQLDLVSVTPDRFNGFGATHVERPLKLQVWQGVWRVVALQMSAQVQGDRVVRDSTAHVFAEGKRTRAVPMHDAGPLGTHPKVRI